jgi:GT2 family glycosyltransferase
VAGGSAMISIIIPTRRTDGGLERLLASIKKYTKNYELVIVKENKGYNTKINEGIKRAKGEYLVFLHDDCEVTKGWAKESAEVGAFYVKEMVNGFSMYGSKGYHPSMKAVTDKNDSVDITSILCISRKAQAKIGFLDEFIDSPYAQDTDWCMQIKKAGFTIKPISGEVWHHQSQEMRQTRQDLEDYVEKKWGLAKEGKFEGKVTKIVIPCAGGGQRFKDAGYTLPKPLILAKGRPLIYYAIESIRPKTHAYQFIFIVQKEHIEEFNIDKTLKGIEPNCEIVTIDRKTEGAAITVLAATHLIYNDKVILSCCDQIIDIDIDNFIDTAESCDGLTATFESTVPHFSYVDMSDGFVKVAEKKQISTHANAGAYYFKSGSSLVKAIMTMIQKNDRTKGEFYMAPAYNCLEDKNINIYPVDSTIPLGTPEELRGFDDNSRPTV